ncbi:MAG: sensor histidine kinase [Betaproteobacteria bacterium]|nr:sensor histidine kinase [Betaproteobacteria bacterium]MCL2885998.1 sensor histidine kinase [Betaproteobacteria bacterium]
MDERLRQKLLARLAGWSHLLLAGHLLMLHLLAFGGWRLAAERSLWVAALGLFLLWQPFIAGEQRIGLRQGGVLLAVALISAWFLGPWLLLIWCGALAGVIGGRVLWSERRGARIGYLLAFGYVISVAVFGVVPEISPRVALDPPLRNTFARLLPILLPLLLAFPARSPRRHVGEAFDLLYGMLMFLFLAVFLLGALAYMLVGGVGYVEALFSASLTLAAALLLVAWAWNPHASFFGVASALSRYLLSMGMPLEQWLVQLAAESEREDDPLAFLAAAMGRLPGLPWVVGSAWTAAGRTGLSGDSSPHAHVHQMGDCTLTAYFRGRPSPSMHWHVRWLLRLAAEFYEVKRQAHELRRIGYLRAVYETGSRVTHDVKNLLQSMQGLCHAAAQPGDPAQLAGLVGRQLPLITERLRATLDKLQAPLAGEQDSQEAANGWWRRLRDRYAGRDIDWQGEAAAGDELPGALFDSVAENLLQNARAKRQREPGLGITVRFAAGVLSVVDDGAPLSPTLAAKVLREPVGSEDGLGIGLYHAARQAEAAGYLLELAENRPGRVVFRLAPPR